MRKRYVALLVACLTLAVPASASAHARSPTFALDYKLVLDRSPRGLGDVRVGILDGDRALRVSTRATPVVVLGDLGEPMLRIGRSGAWANRRSPTAVAQRIVAGGSGWRRVGGSTFAWHDHRLAPPPYAEATGAVARFRIPVRVAGRPAAIAGAFVRYRRPLVWPWLAAAVVGIAAAVAAGRLVPALRARLTVALGCIGGVAAVGSLAALGTTDSPTGGVAWVELGLAAFVSGAAVVALLRLRGEQRVLLAALIGVAAAATTLGSFGVFRHAIVLSPLSPVLARALCAVGFVAGAAAAVIGLGRAGRTA